MAFKIGNETIAAIFDKSGWDARCSIGTKQCVLMSPLNTHLFLDQ